MGKRRLIGILLVNWPTNCCCPCSILAADMAISVSSHKTREGESADRQQEAVDVKERANWVVAKKIGWDNRVACAVWLPPIATCGGKEGEGAVGKHSKVLDCAASGGRLRRCVFTLG